MVSPSEANTACWCLEEPTDLSSILLTVPAQTSLQCTELPEVPGSWQQQERDCSAKGDELGVGGYHSTGTATNKGAIPQALNIAHSAGCREQGLLEVPNRAK